jgi:hypothetical protein
MDSSRRSHGAAGPRGRASLTSDSGRARIPSDAQPRQAAGRRIWRLLLPLLLIGCYSFKGSLPPHLKTVAIPQMENATAEIGLAEEITDLVLERFLSEGLLRVTSDEQADAVLRLTLSAISESAFDYDADEAVRRIKVTLQVKGVFEDRVEARERWSRSFTEWGDYEPDTESREDAIRDAVEKLVLAVNQQLLAEW